MSRPIEFRAWGPNCQTMWDWAQIKSIADSLGWENFEEGERVLMQYTGLTDKNGVKIFEGDICLNKNPCEFRNFIVRFILDGWCLDSGSTPRLSGYIHDHGNVEVIGNIHQHPELLEGKDA